MTREEFTKRFLGRMLLHLTEAWAIRKSDPSALGLAIEVHAQQIKQLLAEMHDCLTNQPTTQHANGQQPQAQKAK